MSTSRTARHLARGAAAVTAVVTLAACGSGEDFNDADVAFATDMIPHHAQAVEMARIADGRDIDPDVAGLAADVEAAQDPEIETMTGWLEEWDQPVPDIGGDLAGMDMAGMMSAGDMSALERADGEEFERLWMELMIEHHRGAIEMALAEQEQGRHQPALDLAEDVERTQADEIAVMEDLLGER